MAERGKEADQEAKRIAEIIEGLNFNDAKKEIRAHYAGENQTISDREAQELLKRARFAKLNEERRQREEKEYERRAQEMMNDEQKKQSGSRERLYGKVGRSGYKAMATAGGVARGVRGAGTATAGFMSGLAVKANEKLGKIGGGNIFLILAFLITVFDGKWLPWKPFGSYHGFSPDFILYNNIPFADILLDTTFIVIISAYFAIKFEKKQNSLFVGLGIIYLLSSLGNIYFNLKYNSMIVGFIGFILVLFFYYILRLMQGRLRLIEWEDITALILAYVLAFFWMNRNAFIIDSESPFNINLSAISHGLFIIVFVLFYLRPVSPNNSYWHLRLTAFLIFDFFGTGYLEQTQLFKFLPFLLAITAYYVNKIQKTKLSFLILIFAFGLIVFSAVAQSRVGTETIININKFKADDTKSVAENFFEAIKQWSEARLDYATGGLYRGKVEDSKYEKLGVFIDNVQASEPRFYTDEPVTLWATIKSKTLSDAVFVDFQCNRWASGNERVPASKIEPDAKFPIFALEEKDVECTFDPKQGEGQRFPAGSHTVTMTANYNFVTDAYQKAYFMDRERYRTMVREELDPLEQYGITDKKPIAVYTNGPVAILMEMTSLVPVATEYIARPALGISLANRKEILGRGGNVLGKWDGRIKNITELIILLPKGIRIDSPDKECGDKLFKEYKVEDCKDSCTVHVWEACEATCNEAYTLESSEHKSCINDCVESKNKCDNDCSILFQGDGTTYTGYALDVTQLKYQDELKDIDRHRSFRCRLYPTDEALGPTPITTRFIRARARYNYQLEKSASILVDRAPFTVSYDPAALMLDTATDKGVPGILILAVAFQESQFKHCCSVKGKNTNVNECSSSDKTWCDDEHILTATARGQRSMGIMQINKEVHEKKVKEFCGNNKNLSHIDCNIRYGVNLLKENYDSYKGGIPEDKIACNDKDLKKKYMAYRGWAAALRTYVGTGCAHSDYVEKILGGGGEIGVVPKIINGVIKIENVPPQLIQLARTDPQTKELIEPRTT